MCDCIKTRSVCVHQAGIETGCKRCLPSIQSYPRNFDVGERRCRLPRGTHQNFSPVLSRVLDKVMDRYTESAKRSRKRHTRLSCLIKRACEAGRRTVYNRLCKLQIAGELAAPVTRLERTPARQCPSCPIGVQFIFRSRRSDRCTETAVFGRVRDKPDPNLRAA